MHSFIHAQALSVNLRKQTLDGASRNISRLNSAIDRAKVCLMLTHSTAYMLPICHTCRPCVSTRPAQPLCLVCCRPQTRSG